MCSAACQPFQSLASFLAGFGLGGGEGFVDEVLSDEAVEDVEDGVAVVFVEGVKLADAFCDGGVGGRRLGGGDRRRR